ncbi:MAG: TlpA disulfide reductase family protein [Parabacteroides sp.]
MLKRLLFLCVIILPAFMSSCSKGGSYRIEGKLSNLSDPAVYAVFEGENTKIVDTVMCKKPGRFSIHQKVGDYKNVTLYFENRTRWITIYLQGRGKFAVTGNARYPLLLQVEGGKINDQLSAVRKKYASLLKEQADLNIALNKEKMNPNAMEGTDLISRLANVNHQLSEKIKEEIKENPDRESSVVLIEDFFLNPDDMRLVDELLAVISPKLKDFYLVKSLKRYSVKAKQTAIGAEAPSFTVRNVYGKLVSLDSFAGKYVLLNFTAPWCDMCQSENKFLSEVATKYSKDKLKMLLVSLDDDSKAVRDLLSKDPIVWNLVTDSAGQAAMLINLYNVSALPRCFLIGKDKKILLKADNSVEIKQTLENLINQK